MSIIQSTSEPIIKSSRSSAEFLSILDNRIGGLTDELRSIVRRVLLTRNIDPGILKRLGLSHVKGLLLYGVPGCGKTLIARELAKALDVNKTKIVNGPELMNKYLGESERNLRDLFKDARIEWDKKGLSSDLHVIIFDELDAIGRVRGSAGGGDGDRTGDGCVNQLLALMDGIIDMSNILVIGLTNRLDLIDPALLRPGRLEVHIEIKVPDETGRRDILKMLLLPIHTAGYLDINNTQFEELVHDLAHRSINYTGADLSGLVRNASSFALERLVEACGEISSETMNRFRVCRSDFDRALDSGGQIRSRL